MFTELTPEQHAEGMRTNFDTALWTAHVRLLTNVFGTGDAIRELTLWPMQAATRLMIQHGVKGKIVLVSSLMGLFSFAGYSAYAPAKHALRGARTSLFLPDGASSSKLTLAIYRSSRCATERIPPVRYHDTLLFPGDDLHPRLRGGV